MSVGDKLLTLFLIVTFVAIGIATMVLIAAAIHASNERADWHNKNCKVIGEIAGSSSIGVGIGSNGSVIVGPVFTSGKTGYQCNDGKTYWE